MRILFALRHAAYLRHFRSTIELLGERGHEVVLVLAKHWRESEGVLDVVEELGLDVPGLAVRQGVETHRRVERDLPSALRHWLAYMWFLDPVFEAVVKPRERVARGLPPELRAATDAAAGGELLPVLRATVAGLERMLPVPGAFRELVEDVGPDLVAVSPLLERGTPQVNYLRAARQLGIPTALCVASWDNLTNKGPIPVPIDLVAVWNPRQVEEAVDLHRVPRDRVVATGAPSYDAWFGRAPAADRGEFCGRVGLPADRPYLLYVCSSGFIAPDEADWIPQWLAGVRGSGIPELTDVPVLVRPHPQKRLASEDGGLRVASLPGVVVHPPEGRAVVNEAALTDYYDAIHHSAAVVGINTSAMIEATFAGRGVHTLLSERFERSQAGLLHFAHLRDAGGGLVQETDDPAAHAEALARAVRGEDAEEASARARAFLAEFIRPRGLDQPATPLLADALEAAAAISRPPEPVPAPPQDVLDRLADEFEPVFHIRRAQTIGTPRAGKKRSWAAGE